MIKNVQQPDIRHFVEQDVADAFERMHYREERMRAHGLRRLFETEPQGLPRGLKYEDESNGIVAEQNHMRVSSLAWPYILDQRRAVILGLWCDEILKCQIQSAAREVTLFWPDASALKGTLAATFIGQVENVEMRLAGVSSGVSATLDEGDDYLLELWNWLRASSPHDQEKRPRLCHISDRVLVENLCFEYRDRNLVLPDELDAALKACGFSSIRARLSRQASNQDGSGGHEDLIDPKEAAKLLGISVLTLHNKKSRGKLSKSLYVKPPGGRIKYRRGEVLGLRQGKVLARPPRR